MLPESGTFDTEIPLESAIFQFLSKNGDGSGVTSQAVNGSGAPEEFYIQPPEDEVYVLKRMNLEAIDSAFTNATNYGAISTLAVGITVRVLDSDNNVVKDFTPIPIKRSHDWGLLSGVDATALGGAGSDALLVRWTFARGYGDIILDGGLGHRFVLSVNDDLTGLDDQLAMVQGYSRRRV